ncbi:hypothetical protein JQV19_06075 [Sulfitobacter mediterraneus]|uniref:hypothetical protein n=1 Tax=Sulfitobacter mediterraneus TaxID=83219 RepID=UPI00193AB16B|nr:hypothetical protein [Sulfitobacter mediterraneus]MBM1556215.1 hypothetical protein [Sulfitobacter mediterraneus]MBM1567747.1 hypothetical protein [Sulfitobacter mediterraneus]MBM1571569.1 hypothetical protein [Sulfitobacter mediterraneus]MBM1575357.1 hypothetical protein [Sulfitobacter mediterraneus]MBM1579152.1 hypothetical protein [Sulfitobacter mediterraneus]
MLKAIREVSILLLEYLKLLGMLSLHLQDLLIAGTKLPHILFSHLADQLLDQILHRLLQNSDHIADLSQRRFGQRYIGFCVLFFRRHVVVPDFSDAAKPTQPIEGFVDLRGSGVSANFGGQLFTGRDDLFVRKFRWSRHVVLLCLPKLGRMIGSSLQTPKRLSNIFLPTISGLIGNLTKQRVLCGIPLSEEHRRMSAERPFGHGSTKGK